MVCVDSATDSLLVYATPHRPKDWMMLKTPQDSKDTSTQTPTTPTSPAPKAKEKKKLSLDISDVSEVLERKISP
jgi:hypothetical protein